jgi:hypothetical protein
MIKERKLNKNDSSTLCYLSGYVNINEESRPNSVERSGCRAQST